MPKSTWSNYKRSGILEDPPPVFFFKIPTFSRFLFLEDVPNVILIIIGQPLKLTIPGSASSEGVRFPDLLGKSGNRGPLPPPSREKQ